MAPQGQIKVNRLDNITYGVPSAKSVADHVAELSCERVYLITSGSLARKTDEVDKIAAALGEKVVGRFSSIPAHSPRTAVIEATDSVRRAQADVIVTVGGGSVTDAAKAIQLCLANGVTTVDGLTALLTADDVQSPVVRQIAVPTTLSGGEFTGVAGVTNEVTGVKEIHKHPEIAPVAVVLDPEITRHTPEWLWTSTGVRAVDHCVEGVSSLQSNVYSDTHALRGLTLLKDGLLACKQNPSDINARLDCQLGAWLSMGTTASGAPMGASHGIGYVLGALCGVPHGHTSCIMLPAVMRWNKEANAERQQLVSEAMGHPGQAAGDVLAKFVAVLGLPRKLSDVGVGEDRFDEIARQSMNTPWIPHNPREISDPSQIREILEMAK
ncbi:iron-containing alcohol dehydrogenase [Ruegeria arenilitoris]|uniref:iron-containing alcohol dehydrogenase n=1 Tax=Ruegeria arenilitoris TaxID=1173585 RepID=UPI00147D63DE|nr:iron-containing alcohol dehydrogenase [Ruegeria arenilitoris]